MLYSASFTNLFSLSKTLRFELKPVPETIELLKKKNIFGKTPVEIDQEKAELYNKELKPMFDQLHEMFITESLKIIQFDRAQLEQLEQQYQTLKALNKDKNTNSVAIDQLVNPKTGLIAQLETKLREVVTNSFLQTGEIWKQQYSDIKLKDNGYKILTEKNVLELLKKIFPEKIEYIKKFDGYFMYFNGYGQNRENYYTSELKSTAIASRIINENLRTFIENRQNYQIIKNVPGLDKYAELFELKNFQNCLTQTDIDKVNEDVIGEINKQVNLYCQHENSRTDRKENKLRYPMLKKLYKQIGCTVTCDDVDMSHVFPFLEKVGMGFNIRKDSTGKYQIWDALESLATQLQPKIDKIFANYSSFFTDPSHYQLDQIWFRKEALNTLSARWFGGENWASIERALLYSGVGKKEKEEYRIPPFVSLAEIKAAFDALEQGVNLNLNKKRAKENKESEENSVQLFTYEPSNLFKVSYQPHFKDRLFDTFISIWKYELEEIKKVLNNKLSLFNKSKSVDFDKSIKDEQGNSIHLTLVKDLIEDGYLRLYQLTQYHNLIKKGELVALPTDSVFYNCLEEYWLENPTITYHKAFQSTLTKKPYCEDKIKLNFECGTLLEGWSASYESSGALIFSQNDRYYLGLINGTKLNKEEVDSLYQDFSEENKGARLVYLTQKVDNKNPPRWFIRSKKTAFSPMVRQGLLDPTPILDIYDNRLFSKTENKDNYRQYLPKLIAYFKEGFLKHQDFKLFQSEFKWKNDNEYDSIAEFYEDTADMCYKIEWEKINFTSLINLVIKEKMYLFQIYNKDFELNQSVGMKKYGENFHMKSSQGLPNLHTMLLRMLLKPENIHSLKLLGGGELFFRAKSKVKEVKLDKSGREVLSAPRYYEDKYFLHFPIEIKGRKLKYGLNQYLNNFIIDSQHSPLVIGIDRGEKNLLYYSIIDIDGNILKQGSLNTIKGTDYNDKLQTKQEARKQRRLDWEEIGNIKNFKEGYLSQAVHEIYQLMIEYQAVVVLEDLNAEFKAKRAAQVEKSVYKKFELALAKKLNHLILKDKKPEELGGVLNAYQLTPAISAGDVGKFERANQWGVMYYVRANYTSTTDPMSGWRKHLYISNSETETKIREFFNPLTGVQINYEKGSDAYSFSYEYKGRRWKLYAHSRLHRYCWNNRERKLEYYSIHSLLGQLFARFDKNKNINTQLLADANFSGQSWKDLVFYWNLLNQIRNTDPEKVGDAADFLQSPAIPFYDSRDYAGKDNPKLPTGADANGAFNIARKGVMILQRIRNCKDVTKFGVKQGNADNENGYYISDEEWDAYAIGQSKNLNLEKVHDIL